MKKVLLMFAFIATLLVGSIGTAGAQVNYTVYDGTGTSTYVPVEGLYTDSRLKCEYVIPADHLTAINGSTISKLTYYLTSSASAAWTCNFQVFVKEVASPTISDFSGMEDATLVYEGTLDATSSTMEVVFSTPYTYNGGNLLIGFYNTNTGNYKSATFAGQTITGASVQGHNSNFSSITATPKNFIPKTTFTVDELHGCLTPTNLAVSDVATYGATVTWTPGNTETDWVVKFNDDEYPVSGTPSYTVTGLTPNTSYVASVKAVCGGTEESEYTTPGVLFTTLPTCPAPTAVTVSNVTAHTADIAWTNGGEETAWTIDYNGTEVSATTNPFTLTGLNAATSYTVKVKANCSEEDESDWSSTASLLTECETFMVTENAPYQEGFEGTTFPPTCWSQYHTVGTSTNTWGRNTYTVHTGNGSAQLQDQQSGNINDLVTGMLNIPEANTYQVNFWMQRSNYSTLKPNEGVKVWVNTTPDTVGGTEIMYIHREYTLAPAEEATGWYEYSAVIPTSGDMYVIFQGISEWGQSSYIDDITVNKAPSCLKPTAVTVSNVTAHTADIAWTNGGTESAWTIDYNGTEIAADSNPFTLTGLNAATSYTVKVKANCSDDDESDWSTTADFRTACDAVVVDDMNPMVEGFEENDLGCWTSEIIAGTYNWAISTSYPHSGNHSVYFNYGGLQARLISPVMDLTGITTQPRLSFYHRQSSWYGSVDAMDVYYRTAADADWTFLANYSTEYAVMSYDELILPNPTATYQIAFVSNADDNYGIYLDDITVEAAPSCLKPTAVTVSNVTAHTADIAWTAAEETEWVLSVNGEESVIMENPYTLTGLTPATNYSIALRAICSATDTSEWSNTVAFTTTVSCPAPTAVTVSNITTNSVDIAWTNGGTEATWTIDYNGTEIDADSNPFTLTGLDASTSYTVKVKANCDADDESVWSATTSFATPCEAIVVTEATPFTEDFNTLTSGIPACWDNAEGTTTSASYKWSYYATGNTGACVRFNSWNNSSGNTNYLKTAVLDLSALTAVTVSFSYKNPTGGNFSVYYTIDGTNYEEIASGLTGVSAWTNAEYIVDDLAGATNARIIFKGTSNYGSGDAYIYLDDVMVGEAPTCAKPTAVTVSNITTNSVDIAWTNGGEENAWTIDYNGTEVPATTNPFTLTGLAASTPYTIKVKANCDADDESAWSTEVSFRTQCAAVAIPFFESFEDNDLGCWTTEETNASYTWHIVSTLSYGYNGGMADGQYAAAMTCSTSSTQHTAKLISPVLDLSTTMFPSLTFSYLNGVWDSDQNILRVYYRTDASAEWTLLNTYNNNVTSWTEETISLPNPTATYQIAFEGETYYGYNIHVDAISVQGTSCPAPTDVVVSNETETSADVNWTAGYEETAWNIRYREIPEVAVFDFEDGMQGWTAYDVDGDTYNWELEDCSEIPHNTPYEGNGCVYSESYHSSALTPDNWLISPEVNLTGMVKFMAAGQDPDYADEHFAVYVIEGQLPATIDATTISAFTQIGTEQVATGEYTEYTFDLSGHTGMGHVAIRHFNVSDEFVLVVDNITIGEEPGEWTVVEGVTNPYTIEGLTANTTYEVQVQAACSEDETSDWTASVEFTTLAADTTVEEPCATPANIAVENNVVTWESEAANFNLMIVANGDTTNATAAGNTYTVEGLENGTEVVVLVQAICDEDNLSDWTEAVTFTFETVGINNYSINAKVYPNPTTGLINVDCAAINADVTVYDMFGKLMMTSKIANERTELDFSAFAPGMYIVRIADANNSTNVKVVKK